MKVKVKTLKQEVFEVELEVGMKVSDVKAAIETQVDPEKFKRDTLTIVCKGKRWTDDEASLEDMGVEEGGAIVVVVKKPQKPVPPPAPAAPAAVATPEPAPQDTSAATAAPATETTQSEPAASESAAAGGASAFVTGSELQASVKAIMEMGFPEADVKRAMRAAFNNPERAVEYLMSGIPEGLVPPVAAAGGDTAPTERAPAAPAAAPVQAQAPSGPNASPLDMWGGGGAAAGTPAAGGVPAGAAGAMSALQSNPQLQQLMQSDPSAFMGMISELARQNPELLQALQSNPQAALSALMGAGGAAQQPMEVEVELSENDEAAISRLEALGFSRLACLQAYVACEKQEEMAANYLLENATDEDMS